MSQLVTDVNQAGPDPLEDAEFTPLPEMAVDSAVIAKLAGELIPLAATAQAEDDAVEDFP
jgi:hypothetical protein